MKNLQSHIMAASLMLLSGYSLAQTHGPTDKDIIDTYCGGKAVEKGRFVNKNGKTTLECDSDNPRYNFEKTNAKLGLDNKEALGKKPYETNPQKWRDVAIDYLFEQTKLMDKKKCTKAKIEKEQLVFHCTPENIILTKEKYTAYLEGFKGYYDAGATEFAAAPDIELGRYLIAKDTYSAESIVPVSPVLYRDYFNKPDMTSKFPGFEKIAAMDFEPGQFRPRYWTTFPSVQANIQPMSYTDFDNMTKGRTRAISSLATTIAGYRLGRFAGTIEGTSGGTPAAAPTADATAAGKEPATGPEVVVVPSTTPTAPSTEKTVETNPTPAKTDDKSCQDQLNLALSKLLEDDKQNIIGHQFELTVLKLTAIAVGEKRKSLEGLIRKKADSITKMDKGIIDQMNQVYLKYGLEKDAQAISAHLKAKAKNAVYLQRDHRFFNEDSSAFLLAYQKMNENSGIKENDVSVLWFMDKVTKKAQSGAKGKYSSYANRTNLSTRIAQYTGLTGAKALSKDEIASLAAQHKKELDAELNGFIESFKQENAACFKELFTEGQGDCHLSVVEASLGQLLAVQSKIPSTDLVTIDEDLKGGFDKTRFQIAKFANEK